MNKELREAVKTAMSTAYYASPKGGQFPWDALADAAISIIRPAVLEETAQLAEGFGVYERRTADNPYSMGRLDAAGAIRALAKEGE